MADLAASIAKARKAGYSDAEIASHIAKDPKMGPKVTTARKAGYNDAEIVGHLGKVNPVADVFKATVSGLSEGMAGIADSVIQASPAGMIGSAFKTAANVASNFQKPPTANKGNVPQKAGANVMANPFSGVSTLARKNAYEPQTTAGQYGRGLGRNAINAAVPGSIGARVVNVVAPTIGAEGAAQITRSAGGSERDQDVARAVGGVIGAGVGSLRPQNLFRERGAAETLATRTRQDPDAMTARVNQFREAGVEPTLTDAVDDAGRGLIRATANRPTEGRQVANDFARTRTLNLPDRMSSQARRLVSDDSRTPDQIREAMTARRAENAARQFGAVRGDAVQLAPEGVQALRTDYGRAAIREAARRERDADTRAALNRLADNALDAPSTPVTVGMADRVSRVLLGQAEEAGRRGDNDLAATLGGLGRSIRSPTAEASPGYRQALDDYGADTRLREAAGVGENFMRRNTDEFVSDIQRLGGGAKRVAGQVVDASGSPHPVLGGELPKRGLVPANMMEDGGVYVGEPGGLHFQIMEKFPSRAGNELADTGFVTPDGRFLDRAAAAQWVRQNEATIQPSENMRGTLDAIDYREQVPASARAGDSGEEALNLARAAARRAVERAAGENVSSASGVARRLADAPEQQARNAALMGERANPFQDAMRAEAQAVENANAIAPRSGSSTFLNASDGERAAGVVQAGVNLFRGPSGWIDAGISWLRTRGINDQQAEAIVRMATDPAQTDAAIQMIRQSLGPNAARQFVQWRNAGLIGAAAGSTGFRGAPAEAGSETGRQQ